MSVERSAGGASLVDVLDRVLDKGIVNTFLEYAAAVGQLAGGSRPLLAAEVGPVPAGVLASGGRRSSAAARGAAR